MFLIAADQNEYVLSLENNGNLEFPRVPLEMFLLVLCISVKFRFLFFFFLERMTRESKKARTNEMGSALIGMFYCFCLFSNIAYKVKTLL